MGWQGSEASNVASNDEAGHHATLYTRSSRGSFTPRFLMMEFYINHESTSM